MEWIIIENLSVLSAILYGFYSFKYSQLIVKLKVSTTFLNLVILFFTILIWAFSSQQIIFYIVYICLYFAFLGIYLVCFEGSLIIFMFASGNFVFHLLCIKGISVSAYAFLTETSMYTIMSDPICRSVSTTILFLSSTIFLFLFRKIFPEEKIKLLLHNQVQIKLILTFQIILNITLTGATMVYYYNYRFIWLIAYHFMLSVATILSFYLLFKYCIGVCIQENFRINETTLNNQIQSQLEQYNIQSKYIRDLRRIKHDYGNQIKGLDYILDSGNLQQAKEYIRDLDIEIMHVNSVYKQFSNNVLIDAILQAVNLRAKTLDIEFEAYVQINALPITDLQACTMFSNILNNALEACEKIKEGKKFIHIKSMETNDLWIIHEVNSFNGEIKEVNGKLQTLKEDKLHHGLGVESIRGIIEENSGELEITPSLEDRTFQIHIVLPIYKSDNGQG